MERFSISVTLGKAGSPHGANLEHNNRNFIAQNVRRDQIPHNILFKQQDVQEAYAELFGAAVEEYNAKQKQPCRRIKDYYAHISSGKREEPYYEVIVQLGDCKDTPCGSRRAEIAQKILSEYAAMFQARNRNLYVFNSVMHLDEASPHLHIDFIPFYTQGRQRGLSKGVSMKAALKEMGIAPKNSGTNQLVIWEERERRELERLLRRREYAREDKKCEHPHLTVEEYKAWKDTRRYMGVFKEKRQVQPEEIRDALRMKQQIEMLTRENKSLEQKMYSPYKSFFYPHPDKQAFVQAALDRERIPYRETDNGFEAQECYVEMIRKIESQYKEPPRSLREKLRDDIDRLLMMSQSFDDFLKRLEAEHYEIKHGKYIAAKPENAQHFIRLKSLGTLYNETALRKRLGFKQVYENDLLQKTEAAKQSHAPGYTVLIVMQNYILYFSEGYFPVRKKNPKGLLTWENDAVLDKLTALNEKLNQGATKLSLRRDADLKQQEVEELKEQLKKYDGYVQNDIDLLECAQVVFCGKQSPRFTPEQAKARLAECPRMTSYNWRDWEPHLESLRESRQYTTDCLQKAETELREAIDMLETCEQVLGGSFLQSMAQKELQRRNAETGAVPNGQTDADAPPERVQFTPQRR